MTKIKEGCDEDRTDFRPSGLESGEISMEKWTHFTKWKASEDWIEDEIFGKKWISPTWRALQSERRACLRGADRA